MRKHLLNYLQRPQSIDDVGLERDKPVKSDQQPCLTRKK